VLPQSRFHAWGSPSVAGSCARQSGIAYRYNSYTIGVVRQNSCSAKRFDHSGSAFDSSLEEEGVLAETEAVALKKVIAWQIEQAMAAKRITKNVMAKRLSTSRTQIDRLLDPSHVGVSIETIARAARAAKLEEVAKKEYQDSLGRVF
jgi:antitoxin HicB